MLYFLWIVFMALAIGFAIFCATRYEKRDGVKAETEQTEITP